MKLTEHEILLILKSLCPEGGYSGDPAIAKLQAKLSICLAAVREKHVGVRNMWRNHDERTGGVETVREAE